MGRILSAEGRAKSLNLARLGKRVINLTFTKAYIGGLI
jgi:hypothetical protein